MKKSESIPSLEKKPSRRSKTPGGMGMDVSSGGMVTDGAGIGVCVGVLVGVAVGRGVMVMVIGMKGGSVSIPCGVEKASAGAEVGTWMAFLHDERIAASKISAL